MLVLNMTKFRGFANTTFSVPNRRGLNRRQVKQVQKVIERNKRIKNRYVPIEGAFTDVTGATQIQTYFTELSDVPIGPDSNTRSEQQIMLKSYNIKLGISSYTNDAGTPSTLLIPMPYRIIIVRSKRGPMTDVNDVSNVPITDFLQQPDPDEYQVYTDEIFSVSGSASSTNQSNISPGFLMHFYKSFKNKKVPHMILGYDDAPTSLDPNKAINNPIYMKVIVDPNTNPAGETYNFALNGFCHLKFFDKE